MCRLTLVSSVSIVMSKCQLTPVSRGVEPGGSSLRLGSEITRRSTRWRLCLRGAWRRGRGANRNLDPLWSRVEGIEKGRLGGYRDLFSASAYPRYIRVVFDVGRLPTPRITSHVSHRVGVRRRATAADRTAEPEAPRAARRPARGRGRTYDNTALETHTLYEFLARLRT